MKQMIGGIEQMKQISIKGREKGITLIALVITIIILLILAAVTIATLTGDNGILTKAKDAKETTNIEAAKEKINLEVMGSMNSNGKIDKNLLNENLRKNIPNLLYNGELISEDQSNRITSLPAVVMLDGYEITIEGILEEEVQYTISDDEIVSYSDMGSVIKTNLIKLLDINTNLPVKFEKAYIIDKNR